MEISNLHRNKHKKMLLKKLSKHFIHLLIKVVEDNSQYWKFRLFGVVKITINKSKYGNALLRLADSLFRIEDHFQHWKLYFFGIIKFSINKSKFPMRNFYIAEFYNYARGSNAALLVELNDCHHETLPGYYYYLTKLGYDVEVATLVKDQGCFSLMPSKPVLWIFTEKELKFILSKECMKKFLRIIFNSKVAYRKKEIDVENLIPQLQSGKLPTIYVQHHIDRVQNSEKELVLANPQANPNLDDFIVNPHYFGNVAVMPKNLDVTNFIVIGDLQPKRRNVNLLFQSIELLAETTSRFKVTVIGYSNKVDFPRGIIKYFDILGRVDYEKMYSALEKADYLLPLLDPDIPQHQRYMKYGTTGTFQLSYGFLKPCVMHKAFADIYGFSEKDSVIYDKNENFAEAMRIAAEMSKKEYSDMQSNLKSIADKIEKRSLRNLARIMNESKSKNAVKTSERYNFVIFCKTYIGDIDRVEILKKSVDKFNVDKIPFFIACPRSDMEAIKQRLLAGNEEYPLLFVSDEEILEKNGIPPLPQNWRAQQVIKLGFYKMGYCNHYSIFDSDCYFIQDFHISDFMFNDNTPYIIMYETADTSEGRNYAQNYLSRKGVAYDFVHVSQVFSRIVLEDMEKNLLLKNNLTFADLIKICPWEFNWYGEWFLKSNLLPLIRQNCCKVYEITTALAYFWTRKRGYTIDDFIAWGCIALVMQNRWVLNKIYKPHPFWKFIKARDLFIDKYYCPRNKPENFLKRLEFIVRCARDAVVRIWVKNKKVL